MDLEDQHRRDLEAYERGELTAGRFPEALRWAKAKLQEDGPVDEDLAALVLRVEMKVAENIKGVS
ncbi:hypothetical protein ACFVH6_25650 [Spirillospora sp. NPDC127200]